MLLLSVWTEESGNVAVNCGKSVLRSASGCGCVWDLLGSDGGEILVKLFELVKTCVCCCCWAGIEIGVKFWMVFLLDGIGFASARHFLKSFKKKL